VNLTHIQLKKIIKEELSFFTNQNKNQSSKYEVASLMLETVSNIKPSQKKVKEALKRAQFNSLVREAMPIYNEYVDSIFESFEKELDSKNSLEQLVEHKVDFCLKEQKIKERCSLIEKALFALYGVKENLSEQPEGEEEKPKGFFGKMKAAGGKIKKWLSAIKYGAKVVGLVGKSLVTDLSDENAEELKASGKKLDQVMEKFTGTLGAGWDTGMAPVKRFFEWVGKKLAALPGSISKGIAKMAEKFLVNPLKEKWAKVEEKFKSLTWEDVNNAPTIAGREVKILTFRISMRLLQVMGFALLALGAIPAFFDPDVKAHWDKFYENVAGIGEEIKRIAGWVRSGEEIYSDYERKQKEKQSPKKHDIMSNAEKREYIANAPPGDQMAAIFKASLKPQQRKASGGV